MSLVVVVFAVTLTWSSRAAVPRKPESLMSHYLESIGILALNTEQHEKTSGIDRDRQRLSRSAGRNTRVYPLSPSDAPLSGLPEELRSLIDESLLDGMLHHVRRPGGYFLLRSVESGGDSRRVLVVLQTRSLPLLLEAALAPHIFAFRILLVLMIGGLLCYALARSLTRPLNTLRMAASNLGQGDLGSRVESALLKRGDEIAMLATDFNRMADRIESLVTAQRRLLRDVSHELRSPLARLNVALGLARQQGAEASSPALDRIERESERLNCLIGELLTLSRLEAEDLPETTTKIDLDLCLRSIAADATFEASSRAVSVEIMKSVPALVRAHEGLLRSALENVIRNAIRHAPESTVVELALESRSHDHKAGALLTMRDHGPGVPEDELRNVFEAFHTARSDESACSRSSGVGLSITKRVVQQLGGTVAVKNIMEGGLSVEVWLPVYNDKIPECVFPIGAG